MKNDQLICAYCGKEGVSLHRDHVVPRSRGGPDNANNIVMACQSCNSAKGGQLASEWLGERCPKEVLLVEARVNAKLKAVFKQRDKRRGPIEEADSRPRLFAYSTTDTGDLEYLGEVFGEDGETVRINAIGIIEWWAGLWNPSGAIKEVQRSRCMFFADREACSEKASALASRFSKQPRLNAVVLS